MHPRGGIIVGGTANVRDQPRRPVTPPAATIPPMRVLFSPALLALTLLTLATADRDPRMWNDATASS